MFFIFLLFLNIMKIYCYIKNPYILKRFYNLECTHLENYVKNILILDNDMPTLYTNIDVSNNNLKKKLYSIEHIYPYSYLPTNAKYDIHNLIKTTKTINSYRSNYKYCDNISNKNNWIQLENNNYVNNKSKLFIPNNSSKGFISRAILYIIYTYNLKIDCIIDKNTLINWFYKYPPTNKELYHNYIVGKIQKTENIFINKYNTKKIIRILDEI